MKENIVFEHIQIKSTLHTVKNIRCIGTCVGLISLLGKDRHRCLDTQTPSQLSVASGREHTEMGRRAGMKAFVPLMEERDVV